MEQLLDYYLHPYLIFGVIILIVFYCAVHQYRSDMVIKKNNLSLNFWKKLVLFRLPFFYKNLALDDRIKLEIRKLSEEFLFITIFALSYFIIGIALAFIHIWSI